MLMMGHRRAPGMEHGGGTNAGAEMLGMRCNRQQRVGCGAEQQVVDHCLVLVGDWANLGWQREDHVEIADREQVGLAGGKPILRRPALTLWAMAIAARVVGDAVVAPTPATFDMSAECRRAALLDRRHDLELIEAHMPGIGSAPGGPMAMKDVCDLQPRTAHGRPAMCRIAVSRRSMVPTGRGGWLQPGSWYWRRGCKGPWCRAWHDPEVSESREYRHRARGGGWRNCAAVCVATRAS